MENGKAPYHCHRQAVASLNAEGRMGDITFFNLWLGVEMRAFRGYEV